VALLFGDGLEFGKEFGQVVGCRVGHFVLEVEENALGGGDCDGVLALVFFDELPEGVRSVVLLERNGHDLVFLDLRPLNSIYIQPIAYFNSVQNVYWCPQ
jgi:hypothetical protein